MLLHHHGMQLVYFLVPLKPFSFSYLPFMQKFLVPSDKRESNNEIQLNFFFSDYNQRFLQPVDPWRPNCTTKNERNGAKQKVLAPKKERPGSFLLKQAVLCWAKAQHAETGSAYNLLTV